MRTRATLTALFGLVSLAVSAGCTAEPSTTARTTDPVPADSPTGEPAAEPAPSTTPSPTTPSPADDSPADDSPADDSPADDSPADDSPTWSISTVPDSSSSNGHGGVAAHATITSSSGDTESFLAGWIANDPTHDDIRPAVWTVRPYGVALVTDSAFGDDAWISDMTGAGQRLVAVGHVVDSDIRRAVIWESRSGDPTVWTTNFTTTENATFSAVAPLENGVIAVGLSRDGTDRRPFVVVDTDDGPSGPHRLEAPDGVVSLAGVTVSADGRILIGGTVTNDGRSQPLTWTSRSPGTDWAMELLDVDDDTTSIGFVGSTGSQFLLTGSDSRDPLVWRSDGSEGWTRTRLGDPDQIRSATVSSAIARDDTVVLGASVSVPGGGSGRALLTLGPDGAVELDGTGPVEQIAYGQNGPLLFDSPRGDGSIWMVQPVIGSFVVRDTSPDPAIAEPGGSLPDGGPSQNVTAVSDRSNPMIVATVTFPVESSDGIFSFAPETVTVVDGTWGPPSPPDNDRVVGYVELVTDGTDTIAVGVAAPLVPDPESDLNDIVVEVFDESGRVTDVSYIDGDGDQLAAAITVDGGRLWVAGTESDRGGPTSARIWTSTDRSTWTRVSGPYEMERARVNDLCPTADGVIAVGSLETDTGLRTPTAWRRVDDSRWETVPVTHDGGTAQIEVCAGRDDVLLAGTVDNIATLWSFDPERGFVVVEQFENLWSITDMARSGTSTALVGPTRTGSTSPQSLVVSSDPTTWHSHAMPAPSRATLEVTGMVAVGDELRLWGRQGRAGAVWTVQNWRPDPR